MIFQNARAQSDIPDLFLNSIDGEQLNTKDIFNGEQPILLVFWASWCVHTSTGLTTIQDDYLEEWQSLFNIKVVAVSVDDMKTSNRAVMVANSQGWEYDIFLDVNGDFKRAMGVNSAPHVFIIDLTGKIMWQQNVYTDGDEERIQEELFKL